MKLARKREIDGGDLESQIRRRIREIDHEKDRLATERTALRRRLRHVRGSRRMQDAPSPQGGVGVGCPRCGRDRDFLTDADGFLAHVLEEPEDTELLDDGKPVFCPACGEVFLYRSPESHIDVELPLIAA